jgi:hypothetical protein
MYEYFAIFSSSMLKFIAGPLIGLASGTGFWATALLTAAGMMATVTLIMAVGTPLRDRLLRRFGSKKRFTKRNRNFVRIWSSYGLPGVALLTPLLFSPPGGALLVTSFGGKPSRILFWMSLSAISWGMIYASALPVIRQMWDLFVK